MKIATAASRRSTRWKTQDVSWDWLLDRLRTVKRTGETAAEYRRMSKDERAERKDVGGFVGGALRGGRRVSGAVTERWLLTLDADEAKPDDWDDFTGLYDWRMALYSTHSHTPERPRLRWIIPLRRAVSPEEYQAVARKVAELIGIDTMDTTTYQPERLMYWPSAPEDGEYVFREQDGPVLDPDRVLRSYGVGDAWKDTSLWPISQRETAVVLREAQRQGDPEAKPGVVGKFCRAYDVPAAIDRWLGDVYAPCDAGSGRYTYTPGSTSGGAVLYEGGKFLYSHHSTDPAGGQLCNAFDLVRLHLFGAQDAGQEAQEITRRPSYRAMCDMIADDETCRQAFLAEHLAEVNADFADLAEGGQAAPEQTEKSANLGVDSPVKSASNSDSAAWLADLSVNRKTGEADATLANATLILRNDPALKDSFGLNTFRGLPCAKRDLPWRKGAKNTLWQDADDANLLLYMEKRWKFVGDRKVANAWTVVLKENAYHEVQDYLRGLTWDGTERLDTLLVRYMGAEDTPYTRAVTRKWMCGAVKRAMEPGCKFDAMLVLVGTQGIGKSRLGFLLSKGWFTDSLTRMDGKEAYEGLRGAWIVEVAELAAAKRSEQEAQKKFISAQADFYRPAYGKNITEFPRQCVFLGSTNDSEPLKDNTGGRRYWPVICAGVNRGQHIGLEQEVDQLWAEAVTRYKAGESLWLNDEKIAEEAEGVQAMLTIQDEDEWYGMVEEFLDIKLPANWVERTPEERRAYIAGDTVEDRGVVGVVRRDQVSIVELRVECFGDRREDMRSSRDGTTRRLVSIMSKMPGWRKLPKKVRVPGYGVQWVYHRWGAQTYRDTEIDPELL